MKRDREVELMRRERARGASQEVAAARSGMSVRTLRKYERRGQLPSELNAPRSWRTRPDPFDEDWTWVESELRRDPALQAKTLFALLLERQPGRYQAGQLRTLQRRVSAWRFRRGPEREVMFPQMWTPGEYAQSDFTEVRSLAITIAGRPFDHLLFHIVLPYSNVEAVRICFSESFEALAEGIEYGLRCFGGAPHIHRTDNLSAAVMDLKRDDGKAFRPLYLQLLAHYGMQPSANHAGQSHQNGDVESAHGHFKRALDQALRARGHRDFVDRPAYDAFLQELVRRRNVTRAVRFEVERQLLLPLPARALEPLREIAVRVNRFSLVRVLNNTYSVPSRLIGAPLRVRVRSEHLSFLHQGTLVFEVPRLRGAGQMRIDYRHLIASLVRKPGAFMNYQYREEMFPRLVFRRAFDALLAAVPARAVQNYLRILHLSAQGSETTVAEVLESMLGQRQLPLFEAVRSRIPIPIQDLSAFSPPTTITFAAYDGLLGEAAHG